MINSQGQIYTTRSSQSSKKVHQGYAAAQRAKQTPSPGPRFAHRQHSQFNDYARFQNLTRPRHSSSRKGPYSGNFSVNERQISAQSSFAHLPNDQSAPNLGAQPEISAYDLYPQVQSRNILSSSRVTATPDVLIQQTGKMEGNRSAKEETVIQEQDPNSDQMSSQIKKQSQIYLHKRSTSVTKTSSKKRLPNTQILNAVAAMDQTAQQHENNLPELPPAKFNQQQQPNRNYVQQAPTTVYNARPTNSPASFSKSPKIPPNPSQDSSIIQNTNFKRSSSQAKNIRNSSVSAAGSTKTNYSHINTTRSSQQASQQRQPSRGKSRVSGGQSTLTRKLEEAQKRLTNMSSDEPHMFQKRANPLINNHASSAYQSPDLRKSKQRTNQSTRSPNTSQIEAIQVATSDLRGNPGSGEVSVTSKSGNASRLDIKSFDNSPMQTSMLNRARRLNEQQNQAYQVDNQGHLPIYREQPAPPPPPAPQAAYNDEASSIVQLQRRGQQGLGGGTTFQSSTMTGGGLSMLVGANLSTYFIGSENESLEDMHTLFVAFYQKKRALLERIQKRSKKNAKDMSSTGIMIQDPEVTQQSAPKAPGNESSTSAQISHALRVETKEITAIVDIESEEDLE